MNLRDNNPCNNALVIGVGGGMDYHLLREIGVKEIIGAEINDAAIKLIEDEIATNFFCQNKDDRIYTIDGRTILKYSKDKFDIILMSFVELYIPFPNSKVFVESYLYTKESMANAYTKLNSDGVIVISKWSSTNDIAGNKEMLKLAITALEAMNEIGIASPENHMYIIGYNFGSEFLQRDTYVSMYIFKQPNKISDAYLSTITDNETASLLYSPNYINESLTEDKENYFTSELLTFIKYLKKNNADVYYSKSDYNLTPASDDKPFFYEFDKKNSYVKSFILKITILSIIIILPGLFILRKKQRLFKDSRTLGSIPLFFILGIAFSLLQISLLQKFTIYLGSPIYSLLVVFCLFPILMGMVGFYSYKIKFKHYLLLATVLFSTVIIYSLFLTDILSYFFFYSNYARMLIVSLILLPYAISIGGFFPGILADYKQHDKLPALLYMTNILGGTVGIVFGAYLAIEIGFQAIEFIAASFYLIISISLVSTVLAP